MSDVRCGSCKHSIANMQGSVLFSCPQCGKYEIIRCSHCRTIASKYICPGCNFEGPN